MSDISLIMGSLKMPEFLEIMTHKFLSPKFNKYLSEIEKLSCRFSISKVLKRPY
jgi:hypothetical protein